MCKSPRPSRRTSRTGSAFITALAATGTYIEELPDADGEAFLAELKSEQAED